MDSKELSVRS